MISWIQAFTQKNHKVLFGTLLIIIVIAFVFTIGNLPTPGISRNEQQFDKTFYGYNLNDRQTQQHLAMATELSAYAEGRFSRNTSNESLMRAASLYLADAMQIPEPRDAQLTEFIRSKRAFTNYDGTYDPQKYLDFLEMLENNDQLSKAFFSQTMVEDWRIQKVTQALRGPGYVLPYEAIQQLRMDKTKWSVDVASFNYDDFTFEADITEEAISDYFEKNGFRYQIPKRVKAAYIYIPSERFLSEIPEKQSESDLQSFYEKNRGLFGGKKTFEEAKDEVLKQYRLQLAQNKAGVFAYEHIAMTLHDEEIELGSPRFNELLSHNNLTLESISPYTRGGIPQHPVLPRRILEQVFEMNRYFSEPYLLVEGIAILFHEKTLPAEAQPLEAVREQVLADMKEEQRREAFIARGEALSQELNTAIADTKFPIAAAKRKLSVQPYQDFSLNNPPEGLHNVVQSALSQQTVGKVSDMIIDGVSGDFTTGYFVYIVNKEVPKISENNEDIQKRLESLQQFASEQSSASVLKEMIDLGMAYAQGDQDSNE